MKALESRLTQKGQVTIPAEIREQLGLKPHDRVRFAVEDGTVVLRPAPSALLQGYGAVTPHQRPENWPEVRASVEAAIADDVQQEG